MTPAPEPRETQERESHPLAPQRRRTARRGGRYVNDAELIERLGVPERVARVALFELDRNPKSGFPKKQKMWGDRRSWPAVEAWLDKNDGLKLPEPAHDARRKP